ncbi:MAG TPA: DoxX family protein [Gemmatirosa sp.]|nr:DoxX family protein [Gemmatirosa sp.]
MSVALVDPISLPAPRTTTAAPSTRTRRLGWALTGLAALFLAFDAGMKLVASPEAIAGTLALGYGAHHLPILAAIQLACLALYVVPRTAPLGAVLWTGYFGGAIATHLRLDNPLLSHTLFPIYVAALVWAGLYLRDARVRALLAARR